MPALEGLAASVAALLKAREETIAIAESSTGGLISAALLVVPGASAYFVGGGVIYTHLAREALLEIELSAHPGMRASTEPYAALSASVMRERLGTVWALAETGATGPTGNRYGDAAGHSCIAVAGLVSQSVTLETGLADREENMWLFTKKALEVLEQAIRAAE